MPTYDYRCSKCETEFEKVVSKPDPDVLQACPKCGGDSPSFIPVGGRNRVKFLFNYFAPDA